MKQSLRDDVGIQRMGKVVGINGWVCCGVRGCDVDGSARERVFEASQEGEIITWVFLGIGTEERTGVGCSFWDKPSGELNLLHCGLSGIQQLAKEQGMLFRQRSVSVTG